MTDYTELVNNLRLTEMVCRDRMDGQVMLDAAAAIEELQAELVEHKRVNRELTELYQDAVEHLPNLGKWIGVSPMVDTVQCSVCGGQLFSAELETPYCPYCGAKMEVQDETN